MLDNLHTFYGYKMIKFEKYDFYWFVAYLLSIVMFVLSYILLEGISQSIITITSFSLMSLIALVTLIKYRSDLN